MGYRGYQQNYVPGADGPAEGADVKTSYPTAQQAMGSAGTDYRKGYTIGTGEKGQDRS